MKKIILTYLFSILILFLNAQKEIKNTNISYDNFNNKINLNNILFEIKSSDNKTIKKIYLSENKLENYNTLTSVADSLFFHQNYELASSIYLQAIKLNDNLGKVRHRYNLACSLATLNKTNEAFDQLDIIINKSKFSDKKLIINEELLNNLKTDAKWDKLIKKIDYDLRIIQDSLNNEIKHRFKHRN